MINLPPRPPREEFEFSVGLVRELELRGLPFEIIDAGVDADGALISAASEDPPPLSLAAFVEGTSQVRLEGWQHTICTRLEKLIEQKGQRLLIHGPPQFGKSFIISQRFPAYTLGYHPAHRVRVACYNVSHAERFSKVNLDLMRDPLFAEMFPDPGARVPSLCPADEWSTAARVGLRDANPSFKALGLGTGFTGMGVDCLVPGTRVTTELGPLAIETLCALYSKPKVLAFDHRTGATTWQRVVATREIAAEAYVEVTTTRGRTLRVTGNHPLCVQGRGYQAAEGLRPGDRLLSLRSACLPAVRRPEAPRKHHVPPVLPCPPARDGSLRLPLVWAVLCTLARRGGPRGAQRLSRCLLFAFLRTSTSRDQERPHLPAVRRPHAWAARNALLFADLSARRAAQAHGSPTGLRPVWNTVSAQDHASAVLLADVRGRSPRYQDARDGQLPLPGRDQLCQVVRGDAPADPRSRPAPLCGVPHARSGGPAPLAGADCAAQQSHRASHQRGRAGQYAAEPGDALQDAPCGASQVADDTVALVRHIRHSGLRVYDLQVESCHNFFAEGILAHNCLIIDDPYKNRMEARSEATNAALWGWWTDVVIPRLNPATNIVVMFHRWWERDFAGLLLEQGGWEMLRFPAIADGQPGDPTGRALGTPLSPRYSLAYLAEVRAQQGTSFEALYQGIPYPAEGGMFKAGAVGFLDVCPAAVRARVRWWDVAATENGGDWTAGVRLAERGDGRYIIEDVIRGRWASHERDRIMRETAERDGTGVDVLVPQDPGAAGKAQADAFIRLLAGFAVSALRESGDKVTRADPLASQWNAGNISLVRGPWNDAFLAEVLAFDQGAHDDQVDAVASAFNVLAGAPGLPYRWKRAAQLPAPLQGHVTEVIPAPPVHTEDEIAAARDLLLQKEIAAEDQAQTSALSAPAASAPTLTSRQERLAAYYSSMKG